MKLRVLVLTLSLLGLGLCAEEPAVPDTAVMTTIAQAPSVALVAAPEAAVTPSTEVAAPAGEQAQLKDGYALLNGLLTLFENIPIPIVKVKKTPETEARMSPGLVEVDKRLSQLGVDSKAALEAGLIDKIFFYRYRRLLMHYKLIIMPVVRGELLKELFQRAFDDFTWNVTYEHWSWEDNDGIAKMAAATEEEFVQMMIYLDTRQKREELKKKIGKRMLPPPPARKKSEEKKPE
ncbi:MAG: hypothetical protein E4H23_00520 [Chrysiogenales bacterium]|nr:MAG: hypothetical protein E4H23_00520 [Chrysiogenales bacterium]